MSDVDLDNIVQGCARATSLTLLDLDCCDVSSNGAMLLSMLVSVAVHRSRGGV